MENTIDLSTVTDINQLRAMYVEFNENKTVAAEELRVAEHNLQAVRNRMVEVGNETTKPAEAAKPKLSPDEKAERNAKRRAARAAKASSNRK